MYVKITKIYNQDWDSILTLEDWDLRVEIVSHGQRNWCYLMCHSGVFLGWMVDSFEAKLQVDLIESGKTGGATQFSRPNAPNNHSMCQSHCREKWHHMIIWDFPPWSSPNNLNHPKVSVSHFRPPIHPSALPQGPRRVAAPGPHCGERGGERLEPKQSTRTRGRARSPVPRLVPSPPCGLHGAVIVAVWFEAKLRKRPCCTCWP